MGHHRLHRHIRVNHEHSEIDRGQISSTVQIYNDHQHTDPATKWRRQRTRLEQGARRNLFIARSLEQSRPITIISTLTQRLVGVGGTPDSKAVSGVRNIYHSSRDNNRLGFLLALRKRNSKTSRARISVHSAQSRRGKTLGKSYPTSGSNTSSKYTGSPRVRTKSHAFRCPQRRPAHRERTQQLHITTHNLVGKHTYQTASFGDGPPKRQQCECNSAKLMGILKYNLA